MSQQLPSASGDSIIQSESIGTASDVYYELFSEDEIEEDDQDHKSDATTSDDTDDGSEFTMNNDEQPKNSTQVQPVSAILLNESEFITLIQNHGSNGSLCVKALSKLYKKQFRRPLKLARGNNMMSAIRNSKFNSIKLTRTNNLGPFVIQLAHQQSAASAQNNNPINFIESSIGVTGPSNETISVPQKRGRKPGPQKIPAKQGQSNETISVPRKRGRKPGPQKIPANRPGKKPKIYKLLSADDERVNNNAPIDQTVDRVFAPSAIQCVSRPHRSPIKRQNKRIPLGDSGVRMKALSSHSTPAGKEVDSDMDTQVTSSTVDDRNTALFAKSPTKRERPHSESVVTSIEESDFIMLIERYGSLGKLYARDIPRYYREHFGRNLRLSPWPFPRAINSANYKHILCARDDSLGPFYVYVDSKKSSYSNENKVNPNSPSRSRLKSRKEASSSCVSQSELLRRQTSTPLIASTSAQSELLRRQTSTPLIASTSAKSELLRRQTSTPLIASTSAIRVCDSMDPSTLQQDTKTNASSGLEHTKTHALSGFEQELEKQKLRIQQETNAISLLQMKTSDHDEVGRKLLDLLKLDALERLQQKALPKEGFDAGNLVSDHTIGETNAIGPSLASGVGLSSDDPHIKRIHAGKSRGLQVDEGRLHKENDDYRVFSWSSLRVPQRDIDVYVNMLNKRIKVLVGQWTKEESKRGIKMIGDDILSEENMNKVARNLPETIEQLSTLGVMGSSDLCRYGDALLHEISDFIEKYILVR